jgi:hypothetical protein
VACFRRCSAPQNLLEESTLYRSFYNLLSPSFVFCSVRLLIFYEQSRAFRLILLGKSKFEACWRLFIVCLILCINLIKFLPKSLGMNLNYSVGSLCRMRCAGQVSSNLLITKHWLVLLRLLGRRQNVSPLYSLCSVAITMRDCSFEVCDCIVP